MQLKLMRQEVVYGLEHVFYHFNQRFCAIECNVKRGFCPILTVEMNPGKNKKCI